MDIVKDNRKLALQKLDQFDKNRRMRNAMSQRAYYTNAPSGISQYDDVSDYTTLQDPEDIERSLDQSPSEQIKQEQDSTWFDSVKKFGSDVAQSGRMWMENLAGQAVDQDCADITDYQQENEDLQLILEYKQLYNQLSDLKKQGFDEKSAEAQPILEKIKKLDEYFTGEGRHHTVIAQQMYNPDNMSAFDKTLMNGMYAFKEGNEDNPVLSNKWIGNALLKTLGVLDWIGNTASQGLNNLTGGLTGGTENGYKTGEVVKRLKEMGYGDGVVNHFMNTLYKGSDQNKDSIATSIDEKKINDWIKYNKDQIKEKIVDLQNDLHFQRTGQLKYYINTANDDKWYMPNIDTNLNIGNIFNPNQITDEFRKEQEKYAGASMWNVFTHPLYMLPETASTVGLYKHQAGAMVGDAALGAAMNYISKLIPDPRVKTLATMVTLIGSSAIQLNASMNSRKDETNLEKIGALQQRGLQEAVKRGVDINSALKEIKDYAEGQLKIDTSKMNDQQLLSLQIAFDIPVQTKGFAESTKEAKKGIEKLVNANNALAIHDYFEGFPFMIYGGSALKRLIMKRALSSTYGKAASLAERTIEAYGRDATNSVISKVARKFIAKDSPKLGLMLGHTGRFIADKAKLAAYEGVMESAEEGAQELLQSRYMRGEYDNYNRSQSAMDLDELASLPNLYKDAVLDYMGLNAGDPDNASENIRKAMNIGFGASFMFSNVVGAFSNFRSNPNLNNTRQLIEQLKADNTIGNLVGTYAMEAQDHAHIGAFFDSYAKNGKSVAHIIRALSDLKNNVDETNTAVRKEDLDADMRLARATYEVFTKYNNDELKAHGIKKNSERHKQFVIDGATAIVDEQMTGDLIRQGRTNYTAMNKDHINTAEAILDPEVSEDRKKALLEQTPFLASMINVFREKFGQQSKKWAEDRKAEIGEIMESHKTYEDAMTDPEFADWVLENDINVYDGSFDKSVVERFAKHKLFKDRYSDMSDKKDFMNNGFIYSVVAQENKGANKDQIKSILNEAWNNKEEKNRIIDKAEDLHRDGSSSESQYILSQIHGFQFFTKLQQVRKAYEVSKDKAERLKKFRALTGVDVDVRRLDGIVDMLKKQLDQLEEREDIFINGRGKNRSKDKLTLNDVYGDLGLQFDDQEKYEKEIMSIAINQAAIIPQMQIANLYRNGTTNDITGLSKAIYGDDAKDSIFKEELDEYLKKQAESISADDLNGDVTALNKEANRIDRQRLSKKAAWKVMMDRLERSEKRMLIARRNFEQDMNIPEGTLQDGYSDDETQTKSEISTAKSDARKNIEQQVMHGSGKDEKTGKEKVAEEVERRKQQQQASVDDDEFLDGDGTEGLSGPEIQAEEEQQDESIVVTPPGVTAEQEQPLSNPEPEDHTKSETASAQEPEDVEEETTDNLVSETVTASETQEIEKQKAVDEAVTDIDIEYSGLDGFISDQEEQAEEKERQTIADSFIEIDDLCQLYFDEDQQQWFYGDEELTPEQAKLIEDELLLLGLSETVGLTQEQLPDGTMKERAIKRVLATSDTVGDLVSSTFFYQPNPKVNEETNLDEVVHLAVAGQEIKFDKPIASGRQLAQKLIQKGWLESTKKYYVVSQPQEGLNNLGDIRDSMTVVMCIEDDSNTYIVSLRQLGATVSELNYKGKKEMSKEEKEYLDIWLRANEHGVFKDHESDLRAWLEMRNVDWSQIIPAGQTIKDNSDINRRKLSLFRKAVAEKAKELGWHMYASQHPSPDESALKKEFERWWNKGPQRGRKSDETFAGEMTDYRRMIGSCINHARQYYAMPGKNLLTTGQIEHQIKALREFRNSIIDQYATKKEQDGKTIYVLPLTPRKDVVPTAVTQSNGRFDNMKQKGSPVFRGLFESESLTDIQNKIESGDIVFGYGTGAYGNEPYAIKGVMNQDSETIFDGRGLSGKVYLFVDSLVKGAKKVPMMLSEEKFDYQEKEDGSRVYRDGIQLCLTKDAATNKLINTNTEGYKPSAAEVLLYMICGQFDMGGMDQEKYNSVVEFFIHTGENTLLEHQPKYAKFPIKPFASKQIAWHKRGDSEDYVLSIAMPDGILPNGLPKYTVKDFTKEDLFGDESKETKERRLEVVKAIASQMHWNTDLAHMNNKLNPATSIGDEMSIFIMYMLQQYGDNTGDLYDKTVEIAGCPQLSLKISDFFDKNSSGGLIPKKDVLTLAWMIKNKKLMTDVSENIFYAPYVFAEGVQTQNAPAKQMVQQAEKNLKPVSQEKEDRAFSMFNKDAFEFLEREFGSQDDINVSDAIEESLQSESQAKDNGGYLDKILFVPPMGDEDIDDGIEHFNNRLKKFIQDYNKTHKDNQLDYNKVQYANAKTENLLKTRYVTKDAYVIVNIFNNGVIKVVAKAVPNNGSIKESVTGVFSKIKSKGNFDPEKSRQWLSDILGIDPSNVIVTDAVMKSATNEDVFGLTNVCLDKIAQEMTGYMVLSKQAGQGVTYHEAWHYVNLLMHDSKERQRIYEDYVKSHKNRYKKGDKVLQVEEDLAEEFRAYVEARNDKSIKGRVKKLFNDILDFVSISRRRSVYRNVFKAIQSGKYKGKKLDQASIKQFQEKYNNGIAMLNYALPGKSFTETQSLKSIDRYQQYFEAFTSISNKIILESNITTAEELLQYTKEHEKFQDVLDTIQEIRDEMDPDEDEGYNILGDLLNSPSTIKKMFKETMLELGLKSRIKKVEDISSPETPEEGAEDATKKEDQPDNVWDKIVLTMSKKDSAAFRTKLFFRTIPMKMPQVMKDGTIRYIEDFDDYGVQKTWSFDESWNLLLNELFSCTSFGDKKDGEYVPTSIMGRVTRIKDSSKFWSAVYDKLSVLEQENSRNDTQLKSQIFSTLCSNKNQISFIQIENPRADRTFDEFDEFDDFEFDSYDEDEEAGATYESEATIDDRSRRWSLMGDNALIIARSVPRRWSKNLASKGFLKFDRDKNKNSINEDFVKRAVSDLKEIKSKISSQKDKSNIDYNKLLNEKDGLVDKTISLFNYIGIPLDKEVLNVFVSLNSDVKGARSLTSKEYFETLKSIYNSDKSGSISWVIESIQKSVGQDKILPIGRSKIERRLDGVFDNFSPKSPIGLLAYAYNSQHPNLQDYSVKGPNGDTYYPINQNNTIHDITRSLNDKTSDYTNMLRKSKYCRASIILDMAEKVNPNDESTQLKLNTFVGMKDANNAKGADYFGITVMEDYLAKLYMTELDQIIFPTMADKKTWYSLSCSNMKLVRDIVIDKTPTKFIENSIYEFYEQKVKPYNENEYNSQSAWKKEARTWFYNLKDAQQKVFSLYQQEVEPYDRSKYIDRSEWERAANRWYNSLDEKSKTVENYGIIQDTIEDIEDRAAELMSEKDLSNIGINEFSNETLQIFSNYFLSELDSLIEYYSRSHIEAVVNDKNKLIENYHGKVKEVERGGVKTKRLDWSGNGGKFRYFYDVITFNYGKNKINLNQRLQALYELQIKIENGQVKNRKAKDDIYSNVGTKSLFEVKGGKALPLDGFELIRAELQRLKSKYQNQFASPTQELKDAMNKKLLKMVQSEIDFVTTPGSPFQLGTKDRFGKLNPTSIPEHMLDRYTKKLQERELSRNVGGTYSEGAYDIRHNAFYNIISNYVLNSAISTIEVEKIYSGDPAFYKWKKNKAQETETITFKHYINDTDGVIEISEKVDVECLDDTYSDKIKRLGGLNSPGSEMRLDYSQYELSQPGFETLASSNYSVLNVEDIEVPSAFLDEIKDQFMRQLIVDWIRVERPSLFDDIKLDNDKVENKFERKIDLIYNNDKFYNDLLKKIPAKKKAEFESMLKKQIKPYEKITVADAQVFIRPELYRKIKMGLGEWSIKPDDNGYSDEIAYNIIEKSIYKGKQIKDGQWMSDPNLYKIVKKFQTNTLKMSYFQNAATQIYENSYLNLPIYNKMAIFPMFKYHRSTNIGRAIYNRMNDESLGNIDMIAFKSAVKVGAVQQAPSLVDGIKPKYDENGKLQNIDEIKNATSQISDVINRPVNKRINYLTDEVIPNVSENTLPVSIQNLKNLRLQLNTHAHETSERSIGTQMFKLAFSNIIDNAYYGTGKSGRRPRLGREVKADIMKCINALTDRGVQKLRQRFFKTITTEDGKTKSVLDQDEIERYVKDIVDGNGLGLAAEDIIVNGGVVASLTQRSVFEQSVSSLVNSEVVDVKTPGGTAIQQSMYGFAATDYGKNSVKTQGSGVDVNGVSFEGDEYTEYNNGEELKWSAKEGSMEVLLTMNFFRTVIPQEIKGDYTKERQWLINNDIIKGTKSDGSKSNPKPFGIGYRIPTQGMSSMFGFIVADVLPEQVGDLIVVPREFTAQTGSDFDVDKLYLATYSYMNGQREVVKQKGEDTTTGAITNRLLDDYIDIITDVRNYANARASIDVITNIIQDDLLNKVLRVKRPGYREGMSQLLPSFQCSRKREFGVGKDGIGPYALNITNMALTQFAHLTLDYGANEYNLGDLDEIYGQKGIDANRISDWLSAMVNAHVDVAKDAYVFDLNLNKITYNMSNFLLRAGKGKRTFLMLAQPMLKRYTETLLNASGIYGAYISEEELTRQGFGNKQQKLMYSLIQEVLDKIQRLAESSDEWTASQEKLIKNTLYYYKRLITPEKGSGKTRKDLGLEKPVDRIEPKVTVFSESRGENAIKNINSSNASERMDALIFQLYAMEAFMDLEKYANAMSELVQNSKIDTKKFGNNIASQFNFENNLMNFRNTSTLFTIHQEGFKESLTKKKNSNNEEIEPDPKDVSKAALDVYFGKTFLDKKLDAALKYERLLLNGQSFKASGLYKAIFFSVCRNIAGDSTVEKSDGSKYYGYNRIYKDDVIQAIGNGIDDIMRFNAFMSEGYKEYQIIKEKNSDAIDFTFGGNPSLSANKMKSLLFGEFEQTANGYVQTTQTIFDRIGILVDKIKANPKKSEYRNLVDRNGNILNDLLLYITPISPSEKYPVGRMILSQPQQMIKGDRKSKLIAAFSELLTSTDKEINELAHDLAFYAYFSTYDQNVRNSFFDLVPPRFRQQYDRSLKHVLQKMRNNKEDVMIDVLKQISGYDDASDFESALTNASNTILDVLSRNYWYDDNYVPRFGLPKKSSQTFQVSRGTLYGIPKAAYDGGDQFPTWIASANINVDSLYIKILSKGGKSMIYRKTGKVIQRKQGEKGMIKGTTYNVYTAVPKAGIHGAGQNQFELYCNYLGVSIFDQNRISTDFAEDIARQEIQERVDNEAKDEKSKWNLDVEWGYDSVPCIYQHESLDTYRASDEEEPKKLNGAKFWFKENAQYKINNTSDVIVYINNIKLDEFGKSIAKNHVDKTVSIGLDYDIKEILEKVKSLSESKQKSGITLTFATETFDGQWNVPQEYFDQKLNDAIENYKSTIPAEEENIDVLLDAKKDDLSNDYKFKNSVTTQFMTEKMNAIIDAIMTETNIKSLNIAANNGKTVIAKSAAVLHKDKVSSYTDKFTKIYADQKMKKNKWSARAFRQALIDEFAAAEGVLDNVVTQQDQQQQNTLEKEQIEDQEKSGEQPDFEGADSTDQEQLEEPEDIQEEVQEQDDSFDPELDYVESYGNKKAEDVQQKDDLLELPEVTSEDDEFFIEDADSTFEYTSKNKGSIKRESEDTENHNDC